MQKPEIQLLIQARRLVQKRNQKAARNLFIFGCLLLPLMGVGIGLWIAALFIRHATSVLLRKGKLIPCELKTAYNDSGRGLADEMLGGLESDLLHRALKWLGCWIPCQMMNYEIFLGTKRLHLAQYAFSDESPWHDEAGKTFALIDESHPRLYGYLVTTIEH